jgi:hypothetical protein
MARLAFFIFIQHTLQPSQLTYLGLAANCLPMLWSCRRGQLHFLNVPCYMHISMILVYDPWFYVLSC